MKTRPRRPRLAWIASAAAWLLLAPRPAAAQEDLPPPASLGCAASYQRVDVPISWFDTSSGYLDDSFGDDTLESYALPFPFDYYGARYTRLTVTDNGWLSFSEPDTGSPAYLHQPIPSTATPAGVIAPFWADFDPTVGGTAQRNIELKNFGTAPRRVFVVTWRQFPRIDVPASSYTFQVAFYETSNLIRFQYLEVNGDRRDMAIGIENEAGTTGIQFSRNQIQNLDGRAMEWRPTFPALPGCSSATPLACGARLTAQPMGSTSGASEYGCSDSTYPASERVYALDLTAVTLVDLRISATDGSPRTHRLFLLGACDLCHCLEPTGNRVRTMLGPGRYYIVADGEQVSDDVPFNLQLDCGVALGMPTGNTLQVGTVSACGLALDFDRFVDGRGVWTSPGWLTTNSDRTYHSLRVDGGTIYTTSPHRNACTAFSRMASWADDNTDQAVVYFQAPGVDVVQNVYGTVNPLPTGGSCCGVRVETTVYNRDGAAHFYEFRSLYGLDFGAGLFGCPGRTSVQAGPLHVDPSPADYIVEQNLTCDPGASPPGICATACATPAELKSADEPQTPRLVAQLFGAATADAVQGAWVHYHDVDGICRVPAEPWMGGYSPQEVANTCDGANSLLYSWRLPAGTQTSCVAPGDCLAPGQEASFTHTLGKGCRLNPTCSTCLATATLAVAESTACAGTPLTLDATGSQVQGCAGTVRHSWTRDGQSTPASGPTYVAMEPTPGAHLYRVTVSCEPPPSGLVCDDSREASLDFVDCAACAINAQIQGVNTACPDQIVTLDASASPIANCPGTLTWSWTRNGVVIPGATFPTQNVQETASGAYDYTVTIACEAPPAGLNCRSTSAPFRIDYSPAGATPQDRGNTLILAKAGADVVLAWVRPPDGSSIDEVLRGTSKLELVAPGPPLLATVPGPAASDVGAGQDRETYYYRVRGTNCGSPGPFLTPAEVSFNR